MESSGGPICLAPWPCWSLGRAQTVLGCSATEMPPQGALRLVFHPGPCVYYLFFSYFLIPQSPTRYQKVSGNPLYCTTGKMKDFSYRFIKCCILMPSNGTNPFPYGKLAIKKLALVRRYNTGFIIG